MLQRGMCMERQIPAGGHRTASRLLDVLEQVGKTPEGFTLSELCRLLTSPKSSMFPLLHTLKDRGYLLLEEKSGRYRIGPKAFLVGSAYLDGSCVVDEIRRIMEEIVSCCSETCHFGMLRDGDVLYLIKVDSPEPIRMMSTVGKTLPAYSTALGKALLSDYPVSALKKLYYEGLVAITEHTVTDFFKLDEQLKAVRREGFAYEVEESNSYIRCIAVPIQKNGSTAAALSIAIPTFRYSEAAANNAKGLLAAARGKIEALLRSTDFQF